MKRDIPKLQETMCYFVNVFDDFLKYSDHFVKIFEDSPTIVYRPHQECPNIFQKCMKKWPKIPEENVRFSKTLEEDPKMFRFTYSLKPKHDISEVVNWISSLVRIYMKKISPLVLYEVINVKSSLEISYAVCQRGF